MEELTFRPKMLVTSTCGGSTGNWTSPAPAHAATPVEASPGGPESYWVAQQLLPEQASFA